MKQRLFLIFLFPIFLFSNENLNILHNYEKALEQAHKQNKNILLYISSDYCPWCVKMKNQTLKKKETISFINKNYIFVSLKRDSNAYPKELYTDYIPTTYIIDKNTNEELGAVYGYKKHKRFIAEILEVENEYNN